MLPAGYGRDKKDGEQCVIEAWTRRHLNIGSPLLPERYFKTKHCNTEEPKVKRNDSTNEMQCNA
eukprot:5761033-Pyramimonas_sp.AAC.1